MDTDNTPCDPNMPRLTGKDLSDRWHQLNGGWKLVGEELLQREFKFPDFRTALQFTDLVGGAADALNHHPDVYLSYGAVRLQLSTHSVGGLTECDFRLAAKVNELKFGSPGATETPVL